MGNIWAYTNSSTKTHHRGRGGNYNNQDISAVTSYKEGRSHMARDVFLPRHSDVAMNMVLGPSHQTKGCAWTLMLPWHKQPLAHLRGLFMDKVCVSVCIYTGKKLKM